MQYACAGPTGADVACGVGPAVGGADLGAGWVRPFSKVTAACADVATSTVAVGVASAPMVVVVTPTVCTTDGTPAVVVLTAGATVGLELVVSRWVATGGNADATTAGRG